MPVIACDVKVLEHQRLTDTIRLMTVSWPRRDKAPKAGQFFMLRCWPADVAPVLSRPISVHSYDPELAKSLLAEAGYADGFSCTLPVQAANQQIATVIQESLRQVGIDLQIETMEQSAYVTAMRGGEYDCYVGATTAGTLSTDNFNQLDPAKIGVTVGGFRDDRPEVTAMIEKASSSDEATAQEGWDEIIDLVYGQYYLVGLCNAIDCYGMRADLEGLKLGKMNYMDVSYVHPAA